MINCNLCRRYINIFLLYIILYYSYGVILAQTILEAPSVGKPLSMNVGVIYDNVWTDNVKTFVTNSINNIYNENSTLLFKINPIFADDIPSCKETIGVGEGAYLLSKIYFNNKNTNSGNPGVQTFIGPTCSNDLQISSRISKQLKLLEFNIWNEYEDEAFDNEIVQMSTESGTNIAANLYTVLNVLNWKKIAIIYCNECISRFKGNGVSNEIDLTLQTITDILEVNSIEVRETIKLNSAQINDMTFMINILKNMKTKARIFVPILGTKLSNYEVYMKALVANDMKTSSFMTIIFRLFEYPLLNDPWVLANGSYDESILQLYDRTIVLQNNYYSPEEVVSFKSKYSLTINDNSILFYFQLFETAYTYMYMLTGAYIHTSNNISLFSSTDYSVYLIQYMRNNKIEGPYGSIYFDNSNQRVSPFTVEVIENSPRKKGLNSLISVNIDELCVYEGTNINDNKNCLALTGVITNMDASILEDLPQDMPSCGFDGELCDQTGTIIIIVAVIITVILVIVVFIFVRRMRNGESANMPWAIEPESLEILENDCQMYGSSGGIQSNLSIHSIHQQFESKVKLREMLRNWQLGNIDGTGYVLVEPYILKEKMVYDKQDMQVLFNLRQTIHDNLNPFIGICVDNKANEFCFLWQHAMRGNLASMLFNQQNKMIKDVETTKDFTRAFVRDILKALDYIHSSSLSYHGGLTTSNCWVDSHWILKVGGCCTTRMLLKWKSLGIISGKNDLPIILNSDLHYFAPEIRKAIKNNIHANKGERLEVSNNDGQKQDMYSFGIILYEMLFKKRVVEIDDSYGITKNDYDPGIFNVQAEALIPLYPVIPEEHKEVHPDLISLMHKCYNGNASLRPDSNMARKITDATLKMPGSLVDQMIKNLEQYTNNLENLVAERTGELEKEQKHAEQILLELIPKSVAEDIKHGRPVEAKSFKYCTIMNSDIVGFTSLCSGILPMEVVELLAGLARNFDRIITDNKCFKIETVGDAYVVSCGVPEPSRYNHVKNIANMTLQMREFLLGYKVPHRPEKHLQCRFGFNSGPVFSGVIGLKAPRFCLFGQTASVASKMEQNGVPDHIQMTLKSYQLLSEKFPEFICTPRGGVRIEGIGTLLTYFLDSKDPSKARTDLVSWDDTDIGDE
uniref:guanylate cyclase n=1 Tax=Parastrongyloides trichosuri TaxID=131310 RepID=A0A0N4ZS00_PARTI